MIVTPMQNIIEREFSTYVRWLDISLDIIWHLTPDARMKYDPLAGVRDANTRPTKREVKALSQAVKDAVVMTDRHSAAEIAALDASFSAEGLPNLTSLRALYSKDIAHLLHRERISSDDEYYLLKSLEDLDVPDDIKEEARALYGKYEIERM